MKKITYMLIMIGALMIVLAACSSASSTDKKSEKLTINTTVFPLKSFTEQIGGKHVEVKSIYPTGTPESAEVRVWFDGDRYDLLLLGQLGAVLFTVLTMVPSLRRVR